MPITPAPPVNFTYKKYTSIPVPVQVTANILSTTNYFAATNLPNWLEAVNLSYDYPNLTASRFLRIKKSVADTLPPGNYTAIIGFEFGNFSTSPPDISPITGNYTVTLQLQDTIILDVSPTVMTFDYNEGDAIPATKPLQIVSENNWNVTKNQSWISLSAINGSLNSTVQIGVDPSSLSFGVYEATVTVNDGIFSRDITILLTVTTAQTGDNFVFLNPQNLEFLSQQGVANPVQKLLNIDSGNDWSAISSESWLVLSQNNGNSGITDINVSVNSIALSIGVYQADITVTSNGVIKKAYIILRVVSYAVEGLQNNAQYFADDRIVFSAGSVTQNSYLVLTVEASTGQETNNYPIKQPYFRGIAKAFIGLETPFLLPSIIPTNDFASRIKNDIQPVRYNITAFEEGRFTGVTVNVANYTNLRFLKGRTPSVPNRLCFIPQKITVSNQAVLQLTILSQSAPSAAELTGAVTATINVGLANDLYVYSLLLNLSQYPLSQGDVLNVAFGGQNIIVQIDNDYVEVNTIAFENEWGTYEFFETTGELIENAVVKQKLSSKSKDGKNQSRILEADEDTEFTLNTGFIQTREEVDWLKKVLYSKRFFFYVDNTPVEVVLVTRRLQVYRTRNHIDAYQLKFKKAIV
ncbi:MAG: BACON domain-containing protein [Saonia sp.]